MCVCDVSETLVRDVKQSTSTDILKKKKYKIYSEN